MRARERELSMIAMRGPRQSGRSLSGGSRNEKSSDHFPRARPRRSRYFVMSARIDAHSSSHGSFATFSFHFATRSSVRPGGPAGCVRSAGPGSGTETSPSCLTVKFDGAFFRSGDAASSAAFSSLRRVSHAVRCSGTLVSFWRALRTWVVVAIFARIGFLATRAADFCASAAACQVGFSLVCGAALICVRQGGLAGLDVTRGIRQHDVGAHAFALGRRAGDPEELLDRDLEDAELDLAAGGAVEIGDGLHRPLAMGGRAGADDERAPVVLERAREDLRRGGAEPIDEKSGVKDSQDDTALLARALKQLPGDHRAMVQSMLDPNTSTAPDCAESNPASDPNTH